MIFGDGKTWQMSRAGIVLTASNQDGGAHVDSSLRADYAGLRFDNSLGWVTSRGGPRSGNERFPPDGDPIFAAIRQIAHEVLKTFLPGYSRTSADVDAARKPGKISDGKMYFFPHETMAFMLEDYTKPVPGLTYIAEFKINSITTGSVRAVINSRVSDPITTVGMHRVEVVAAKEYHTGFFGEFTDAVIDLKSLKVIQG